ncbi:MAG: hypothetical protein GF334_09325, partial [Candidatus Altiarchaeales archaeon]|nr:hypothetical protein [Candidatus Altiarchaeales archaeon]
HKGGEIIDGVCEPAAREIKVGEVIQFERFGFARLDEKKEKLVFIYTHK